MLHAMALTLAFVLALISPAAAETFDFSWTSMTTLRLGQSFSAEVVGGTISGHDPAAMWDRNTGVLNWMVDGQVFGGFLDVRETIGSGRSKCLRTRGTSQRRAGSQRHRFI